MRWWEKQRQSNFEWHHNKSTEYERGNLVHKSFTLNMYINWCWWWFWLNMLEGVHGRRYARIRMLWIELITWAFMGSTQIELDHHRIMLHDVCNGFVVTDAHVMNEWMNEWMWKTQKHRHTAINLSLPELRWNIIIGKDLEIVEIAVVMALAFAFVYAVRAYITYEIQVYSTIN